MTLKIELLPEKREEQVAQALEWINSGLIIAAPLENGYVYLADAFTHDAVRAMHVLRGDDLGIAAQVLISNIAVLDGIAREISAHARTLMNNFWPGMLSVILRPHRGLSWDLGDGKRLDQICVRVPNAEFVLALLQKSGPLAVVSVANMGHAPVLEASLIVADTPILAGVFDGGELLFSIGSTVVSDTETPPSLVRNGSVSLEALREHIPDMEYESSGN